MTQKLFSVKNILSILCLVAISQVQAKEIEISPSLGVGVGYSDNIRLRNTDKRSSAYTTVTPGIQLEKEGSRVKTTFNYNMTGLFYASESDLDDVQHRLFSKVTSELVKNSIFLDLDATASQQLLNGNQNSSINGISGSQNLTQTYTYGASPYWKKKWQNFAESTLRYNYDEVKYGSSSSGSNRRGGDDSQAHNIVLNVESGKSLKRYFWNFDYDYKDVSYDKRGDTDSEAYKLRLGYRYSKKLNFTYTTGYEDYNDGRNTSINSRNGGGTGWRTGLIWNPSTRTSLEAEVGRRFFGTTYLLEFKHRSRRFTWELKYDDDITSTRNQIVNNTNSQQANPDNISSPLTDFRAQYYLSRKFSANVSYNYRKSTVRLGVFNEKRYFDDSDIKDEDDMGVDLSWSYRVGQRTDMITRIGWQQLEDSRRNNSQERNNVSWSLNRRLSPTLSAALLLSYVENSADIKRYEYDENAISLNMTKRF